MAVLTPLSPLKWPETERMPLAPRAGGDIGSDIHGVWNMGTSKWFRTSSA